MAWAIAWIAMAAWVGIIVICVVAVVFWWKAPL